MLTRLTDIEKRDHAWVWPGRIPLGYITNLEADAGSAKTTCALDIVARVTTGRTMPDGAGGIRPANVLLLAAEDDLAAVIIPRLVAAGADLSRVIGYDADKQFRIPDDLPTLAEAVKAADVKLVMIDPIPAFIDSASTSDVRMRRSIGPLARFAAQNFCAVLNIRHFKKADTGKAMYRGAGSLAFTAAARSVLAVVSDPNSNDQYCRVLVQTKSNLGAAAESLAFRSVLRDGATAVEWLGPCQYTAEDLLGDAQLQRSQREYAMYALYTVLQDGPVRSNHVEAKAREAGISKRTLDRARHDLRVRARKHGSGLESYWTLELPDDPKILAALRERDLAELTDALCHGLPEIADSRSTRSSEPAHDVSAPDEHGEGEANGPVPCPGP